MSIKVKTYLSCTSFLNRLVLLFIIHYLPTLRFSEKWFDYLIDFAVFREAVIVTTKKIGVQGSGQKAQIPGQTADLAGQ